MDGSPRYSRINPILLLQQVHGDGQSGGGRGRAKSRGESIGHISKKSEGQFTSGQTINQGQNYESVNKEAQQDRHEVEAQLTGHHTEIFHLQDLTSDEKEDAHRSHINDPSGDGHHSFG